ncbi:hypothetical protein GY15_18050 [Delftia sp. 670]|nr:hypothetical protein GY15_18050 [Delftia sp. 670]
MSRWFIVAFSLHFVVSVALSTLGLVPWRAAGGRLRAGRAACASVQRTAAPLVDTASLLDDFDHALMDDQQDLPDVMHAVDGVDAPRLQADRHVASSLREGPWRSLAPPDRPPRAA